MKKITIGTVLLNESNSLYYHVDSIEFVGSSLVYNCTCGRTFNSINGVTNVIRRCWIRSSKAENMLFIC